MEGRMSSVLMVSGCKQVSVCVAANRLLSPAVNVSVSTLKWDGIAESIGGFMEKFMAAKGSVMAKVDGDCVDCREV